MEADLKEGRKAEVETLTVEGDSCGEEEGDDGYSDSGMDLDTLESGRTDQAEQSSPEVVIEKPVERKVQVVYARVRVKLKSAKPVDSAPSSSGAVAVAETEDKSAQEKEKSGPEKAKSRQELEKSGLREKMSGQQMKPKSVAFEHTAFTFILLPDFQDYFDVIDTPMDFGTICNNIRSVSKYKHLQTHRRHKDGCDVLFVFSSGEEWWRRKERSFVPAWRTSTGTSDSDMATDSKHEENSCTYSQPREVVVLASLTPTDDQKDTPVQVEEDPATYIQ